MQEYFCLPLVGEGMMTLSIRPAVQQRERLAAASLGWLARLQDGVGLALAGAATCYLLQHPTVALPQNAGMK